MKNLKVYYIYHSCFLIETKEYMIIFDYFKNRKINLDKDVTLIEKIYNTDKKVMVFSSHSHHDHFNKEIFSWKNKYREINYILSDDIIFDKKINNCYSIKENEQLILEDIIIKTYGSTDLGVSFLIELEGKKIFHAGDLNWWYWKDDTKQEEEHMRTLYQSIVAKILLNKNIDIAFFPVDPRLEEFCYLGAEYFAENVKPKIMIPMHFDESYYVSEEIKNRIKKFGVNGVVIEQENSLLEL